MKDPIPGSVTSGLVCLWSGACQVQSVTRIPTGVTAYRFRAERSSPGVVAPLHKSAERIRDYIIICDKIFFAINPIDEYLFFF